MVYWRVEQDREGEVMAFLELGNTPLLSDF